jgi:hypothetical protein
MTLGSVRPIHCKTASRKWRRKAIALIAVITVSIVIISRQEFKVVGRNQLENGIVSPKSIGLFYVIDSTAVSERNLTTRLNEDIRLRCNERTNDRLSVYVLHDYPQQSGSFIENSISSACSSNASSVHILHSKYDASALNLILMDAYLDGGIDFYYIAFVCSGDRFTVHNGQKSQGVLESMLNRLKRSVAGSPTTAGIVVDGNVGAASILSNNGSRQPIKAGMPRAIMLSKTHFDVFGIFLPPTLHNVNDAISLVIDVYSSVNFTTWLHDEENKVANLLPETTSSKQFNDLTDTLTRYLLSLSRERPPSARGLRVIAMSLYGSGRRYTMGAVRNAQLAPVVYPGWLLRFYCERPGPSNVYGAVPPMIIRRLEQLGAEIMYLEKAGNPRSWRFHIVEDENVEIFIIRDCDSRLTSRDSAVVADWINQGPGYIAHCIRDHPSHTWQALNAGLWGARREAFARIFNNSFCKAIPKYGDSYMADTHFLNREVWPKIVNVSFCHDSFSCNKYPSSHPLPVARIEYEHLGQVYDQFSVGRQDDINVLKRTKVNVDCNKVS